MSKYQICTCLALLMCLGAALGKNKCPSGGADSVPGLDPPSDACPCDTANGDWCNRGKFCCAEIDHPVFNEKCESASACTSHEQCVGDYGPTAFCKQHPSGFSACCYRN